MPVRIPVCIAERRFPSLNQARIHYRDILHRYRPGQSVAEPDRQQVAELMSSSGTELPTGTREWEIRVVHGYYGRTCFASVGAGRNGQVISIMRAVKQCVVMNPPALPGDLARNPAA